MRKTTLVLVGLLAVAVGCQKGGAGGGTAGKDPQTDQEKTIYALGLSVGKNLQGFNLTKEELPFLMKGIEDELTGQEPKVKIEEFGPKIGELYQARVKSRMESEKQKSVAFLEQAAKEEGAQKSESGLVYKELQAGSGASPTPADTVRVHYRGTFIDGKEFDSSYKRNEPTEFQLSNVIPCWTEGVQKMKVGGKAKLVCPSSIAYGDRGRPQIPGGATLVFEIELLDVKSGAQGGPTPPPPGQPGQTQPAQQQQPAKPAQLTK